VDTVYCGQTTGCIRIPLSTEVGLSSGDITVGGNPAPPSPQGHSPQFSAHVRCGQTAGWTETRLGMEVGLGPEDFVLDGDSAPPMGTAPHPIFGPCYCGQTAGWIMMPLGTEVDLGHATLCWTRTRMGHSSFPLFGACPKLTNRSQPLMGRSSPYFKGTWQR